jgi:Leu/Phe-tRNA-protein transferase
MLGFFPMAILLSSTRYVAAIKIHTLRCVIYPASYHVANSVRKKSAKLSFTHNAAFADVIKACIAQHGENWLFPPLVRAFTYMHTHPAEFKTQLHSFEAWQDGRLVRSYDRHNMLLLE